MAAHINADLYSDKSDIASVIAALNNLHSIIQKLPDDTILNQIKNDTSIVEAIDILQDVHDEIYNDDDYQVND